MHSIRLLAIATLLALPLAACGDDGNAATADDGGSADAARDTGVASDGDVEDARLVASQAFCDDVCERDELCEPDVESPYCSAECAGVVSAYRPEARDSLEACLLEADSCEAGFRDDLCLNDAIEDVGTRELDERLEEGCAEQLADCPGLPGDFCGDSELYEDDVVMAALECLEPSHSCDMVLECLEDKIPRLPRFDGTP